MKSLKNRALAVLVLVAILSACLGTSSNTKKDAPGITGIEKAPPEGPILSDSEFQGVDEDLAELDTFLSDLENMDIDISEVNAAAFT